jgi:hypothetical protein
MTLQLDDPDDALQAHPPEEPKPEDAPPVKKPDDDDEKKPAPPAPRPPAPPVDPNAETATKRNAATIDIPTVDAMAFYSRRLAQRASE